ncbi:TOMM precursor leader peptide-binding protein [Oceanibaculum nanhaiense]|uniref:TOMM precursor leader peptide-binding protein n=1 Tax=Oceanibaculum nanhaiense TaxID=1909734 RepID=UPI00396E77F4
MSVLPENAYLAIAPHFAVHRQGEERLLLLSETQSYRLTGGLYIALLPLLDGRLTAAQIVDSLARSVDADTVRDCLKHMMAKSYIVPVPAPSDLMGMRPLHAYWSARGQAPDSAIHALQGLSVSVLPMGSGESAGAAAAERLTGMLSGSGISTTAPDAADLLLVLVDDYLQESLASFASSTEGRSRRWIPLKPGGVQVWIGPIFGNSASADSAEACYFCLARRLMAHRPGDSLIPALPGGLRPALGWTPGSLSLAFGLAATEIADIAMEDASRLAGHLVTLDSANLALDSHAAPHFQDCPVCGAGETPAVTEASPIRLNPAQAVGKGESGWRALSPAEALAKLHPIVSPLTGIVARIDDHELAPGLHVAVAAQANRESVDPRQNRGLGKPGSAGGKGINPTQARISCLAEAVERYACGWTGSEPRRLARLDTLGSEAVHPQALLGFSAHQYANRDSLNKQAGPMHKVPQPFNEGSAIEWSPAWSLTQDAPRWLPTRFCYFDYAAREVSEDHAFCIADSNGCASGGTREEAILQGLLEVIERDAIAIWWYNRLHNRPAARLEGVDSAFLQAMEDYARRDGLRVEVLDLTTDLGIPVMGAIASQAQDGSRISIGFGAHLDPAIAATRALTELNQGIYFNALNTATPEGKKTSFDDARDWFETAVVDQHPYLRADTRQPGPSWELPRPEDVSIVEAVDFCVERLAAAGHETVVLDYDRRDVPLACVKVAVPGLCHFWNRRGADRLFTAPVRQGILDAPLAETALNPINFFL